MRYDHFTMLPERAFQPRGPHGMTLEGGGGGIIGGIVDAVKDVGNFIDDNIIQPIVKDPLSAIATVVGATLGGPVGAGIGNTVAGLVQGESPEEAVKGGVVSGLTVGAGQALLGGGPVSDVAPATGVEVFPVAPPAPVTITPIDAAGSLLGNVAQTSIPAVVPSAFETAIATAPTSAPTISLGPTTELGSFGSVGTAGFGTALPSAADVTAGLISAGVSPGTAANIAGETAAGVGPTNLLGGATAATPLAAPPTISIQDALRGARLINSLLTPQQPQVPNMLARAQEALAQQGGVDYSTLLGLLSRQAGATGLLGTRYQPQPINIASLLG